MFLRIVIGLVLVGASQQAKTTAEIRAEFIQLAMECSASHPITPQEMMLMKSHKIPDSENAKCMMGCVMSKAGFLDNKGNFDIDHANAWAGKEFQDDPKRLEGAKNIYDVCKKVNDEAVSDGEKGCDRAYYLTKCLVETAPKMGFPLPQ